MSAEHGRSLFMWTLCCIAAGMIFLAYAFTSLAAGRGEFVLPLDDTYIHFQYAKQMALGQPYVYNPGQPATSGATSFLYPYLLAVGYLIGFQGLSLGVWALGLGALALTGSMWLVYRLARLFDAPFLLAMLVAIIFALTGAVSWHYMSGMETGFVILFALLTLYGVAARQLRVGVVGAALLALIRPEGGILTLLAVGAMAIQHWRVGARYIMPLLLPVAAVGIQPLVNLIFTGSIVATGNQAKSILAMIPPDREVIIGRILENFGRMWAEFATGASPREGVYVVFGVMLLAMFGMVSLLIRRERRLIGLMLLGWLLAGTAAIATLDPAFWHFKRYQMPLIALFFPLAAWGAAFLYKQFLAKGLNPLLANTAFAIVSVVILFSTLVTTSGVFLRYYAVNVIYVWAQPLAMARWLNANTPPDATVAVHDVGMMRYMGGRTTIDMVGLTTPGAADYWRNGPGSVAEFLENQRPDYIAAYDDARGLSYLADTDIYGEPLAGFPVTLDNSLDVSLAGEFQGIYRPDWTRRVRFPSGDETRTVDVLDVGDLISETEYQYRWSNREQLPGFPTEIYEQNYVGCDDCLTMDGGRRMNGEEAFTLPNRLATDYALVTTVHAMNAGTVDIFVNDQFVDRQWIPELPGRWFIIPTSIPAEFLTNDEADIRIVPNIPNGHYMPYSHVWMSVPPPDVEEPVLDNIITTFQDGAIEVDLIGMDYSAESQIVDVELHFRTVTGASGDYLFFVHVYDDINAPPVAQTDMRPSEGRMPPGNWIPNVPVRDRFVVDLAGVEPGTYQVAIGMYDPVTGERLQPIGGDESGRLFIGEIEIEIE